MDTTPKDIGHKSNSAPGQLGGSRYFARKSLPTRVLGSVLLILASPVILLLVIIVRLTSRGPGLYRQERSGRHGVPFTMYKIRTMYNNAESITGPIWCVPNDSRITPIGKLMRFLHLDELPQLINVARGEMDLIGPRPERTIIVTKLAREIPNYGVRLQVLPGVTGLAQINLPPDQTLECVRRKLLLDFAYIREASFFLDMRILLCTFLRMIGVRHGRAARWLGISRDVHLVREGNDELVHYASTWSDGALMPAATSHLNGHAAGIALFATPTDAADSIVVSDAYEPADVASLSSHRPR